MQGENTGSDSDGADCVPELIINHGFSKVDGLRITKFKVRWVGFPALKDCTWHRIEDLADSMGLVADYLETEGLSLEDVEARDWEESGTYCAIAGAEGVYTL